MFHEHMGGVYLLYSKDVSLSPLYMSAHLGAHMYMHAHTHTCLLIVVFNSFMSLLILCLLEMFNFDIYILKSLTIIILYISPVNKN